MNNAGYSLSGALETLPMDELRRQFETNVLGLVRMTQLVLPGMRRAGWGRIVNIGSMGGRLTFPGGGAYHATKYAVEALSDALRFEVAGFGVRVVLIEPGFIRTEFAATASALPPAPGAVHVVQRGRRAHHAGDLRVRSDDAARRRPGCGGPGGRTRDPAPLPRRRGCS